MRWYVRNAAQCDEEGVALMAVVSTFSKGLNFRINCRGFAGPTGEIAEFIPPTA